MAGVPGPNSGYPRSPPPPYGPLLVRTQPFSRWIRLFSDTCEISKITSQRLLDQSQAGVYRGKRHIPPHFGPFWAYSRTLP